MCKHAGHTLEACVSETQPRLIAAWRLLVYKYHWLSI